MAFQKRWPVMRGKINMICKERTNFCQFSETFLAFPAGLNCTSIDNSNIYVCELGRKTISDTNFTSKSLSANLGLGKLLPLCQLEMLSPEPLSAMFSMFSYHIEAETKWPPFRRWHFQNTFSWMKMCEFRLRFHWSLFPRVKLTIFHPWFR